MATALAELQPALACQLVALPVERFQERERGLQVCAAALGACWGRERLTEDKRVPEGAGARPAGGRGCGARAAGVGRVQQASKPGVYTWRESWQACLRVDSVAFQPALSIAWPPDVCLLRPDAAAQVAIAVLSGPPGGKRAMPKQQFLDRLAESLTAAEQVGRAAGVLLSGATVAGRRASRPAVHASPELGAYDAAGSGFAVLPTELLARLPCHALSCIAAPLCRPPLAHPQLELYKAAGSRFAELPSELYEIALAYIAEAAIQGQPVLLEKALGALAASAAAVPPGALGQVSSGIRQRGASAGGVPRGTWCGAEPLQPRHLPRCLLRPLSPFPTCAHNLRPFRSLPSPSPQASDSGVRQLAERRAIDERHRRQVAYAVCQLLLGESQSAADALGLLPGANPAAKCERSMLAFIKARGAGGGGGGGGGGEGNGDACGRL